MSTRPLGDWLADICIIFTILFILGIVLVIGTILFAYVRATMRERRSKRDIEVSERAKYRSDERLLPPSQRGLCSGCEKVFDKVYCMPSGERLCQKCYEEYDPVEVE